MFFTPVSGTASKPLGISCDESNNGVIYVNEVTLGKASGNLRMGLVARKTLCDQRVGPRRTPRLWGEEELEVEAVTSGQ